MSRSKVEVIAPLLRVSWSRRSLGAVEQRCRLRDDASGGVNDILRVPMRRETYTDDLASSSSWSSSPSNGLVIAVYSRFPTVTR
jgi:hypothetical protein